MAKTSIQHDYDSEKFDYMEARGIHPFRDSRNHYYSTTLIMEGQEVPQFYVRMSKSEFLNNTYGSYSYQLYAKEPEDFIARNINIDFFTYYYEKSGVTIRSVLLKGIGSYIGHRQKIKDNLLYFFKVNGKTHRERELVFSKISLNDMSLSNLDIQTVHEIMTSLGSTTQELKAFYPKYLEKRKSQLKKPSAFEPVQLFLQEFHHNNAEELKVYFSFLENLHINYNPDALPDIFDDRHPITTAVTFNYRKLMRIYPMTGWNEKSYLDVVKKLCSAMSQKYQIDKFQVCFTDKHRGTAIAVLEHNTPEMDNDKFQRVFAAFFLSLSRLEMCSDNDNSSAITNEIVGTWLLKHDIEKLLVNVPKQAGKKFKI